MDTSDAGIDILELKAKGKEIRWSFSHGQSAQSNASETVDHGDEDLELNHLTSNTIKFLVSQLQLLAEINRGCQSSDSLYKQGIPCQLDDLIRILGEYLHNILFKGKIQEHLSSALKKSNLLRVELVLEDSPELENWPWEYLYMPWNEMTRSGEFLATTTQLVLSRRLYPARPLTIHDARVKVLLIVSEPKSLAKVQCSKVVEVIRELSEKQVVELCEVTEKVEFSADYAPTVTRQHFINTISNFQPNIIHFVGHGQRTHQGGGQVAFVKGGGEPDWVSDEQFAEWAAASNMLKLVFLQACESALSDPSSSSLSMAMQLAHRHIPAVVAMQYKIESEIANTFACAFYRALALGESVDLAVKTGREAIGIELPEARHHAIGLPVVYLSSYESLIVQKSLDRQRPSDLFHDPTRLCPSCGKGLTPQNKYCSKCGHSVSDPSPRLYCSFCKEKLANPLDNYCDQCGKRLKCEKCSVQYCDKENSPFCYECRNRLSMGADNASLMVSAEQ